MTGGRARIRIQAGLRASEDCSARLDAAPLRVAHGALGGAVGGSVALKTGPAAAAPWPLGWAMVIHGALNTAELKPPLFALEVAAMGPVRRAVGVGRTLDARPPTVGPTAGVDAEGRGGRAVLVQGAGAACSNLAIGGVDGAAIAALRAVLISQALDAAVLEAESAVIAVPIFQAFQIVVAVGADSPACVVAVGAHRVAVGAVGAVVFTLTPRPPVVWASVGRRRRVG